MKEEHASLLVVDDDDDLRNLLARRLERKGFAVATASDARQGLELIQNRPIDLVLLDHMMPGVSGLEALKLVRQKYSATMLPVIMVTARNDSGNIADALELGASDYITKPVDFPMLLARIQLHLSRKRAKEPLAEAHRNLERRVEEGTAELQRTDKA